MVRQRTLTPSIEVRILAGHPPLKSPSFVLGRKTAEFRRLIHSHCRSEGVAPAGGHDAQDRRGAHGDPVAAACAILKRAGQLRTKEADCLVFPGVRDGMLADMTLSKIVKPTGLTVHGFRASLRTWAAERMPTIPERGRGSGAGARQSQP